MEEPTERRSNRSRKPRVPFDKLIQSLKLLKPFTAPKPSEKPTKSIISTANFTAKSTKSAKPSAPADPIEEDPIEELCSRVEALDLTAQKKAKAAEIA